MSSQASATSTARVLSRGAGSEDLYRFKSPSGASVATSVGFLVPFCEGTRVHEEWVHSKVPFDRARAEAGERGFTPGAPWQPKEGRRVMELAAVFDPGHGALALKLAGGRADRFPTWQAVVDAARRR